MRRLVAVALLALAPACTQEEKPLPPPMEGQLEPIPNPHGSVTPLPDPELQEGSVGRAPRRITVDQLHASILTTVGQPWTDLEGGLGTTLGRADFANIVTENIEPNLVFAKFLEDGARKICKAQARAELDIADPALRNLSRNLPNLKDPATNLTRLTDAQVTELMVYLSTRFWGAPLSGEELPRWKGLFTQVAARAEAVKARDQAFAAMCIAMMTDPRFLTY